MALIIYSTVALSKTEEHNGAGGNKMRGKKTRWELDGWAEEGTEKRHGG